VKGASSGLRGVNLAQVKPRLDGDQVRRICKSANEFY
jgi:hypothetical protein